MSEADRIRREQNLKDAMMSGPNQPVPMSGYHTADGKWSPSTYYQTLLESGLQKQDAQQKTYQMMQNANDIKYNQTGSPIWSMEGEF